MNETVFFKKAVCISIFESSRYKFESKLGSVQCTGLVCMKVAGLILK